VLELDPEPEPDVAPLPLVDDPLPVAPDEPVPVPPVAPDVPPPDEPEPPSMSPPPHGPQYPSALPTATMHVSPTQQSALIEHLPHLGTHEF
jgi:hypothetical protein